MYLLPHRSLAVALPRVSWPLPAPGSIVAMVIKDGAHHLDLMFSDPDDPDSVLEVRRAEMQHVRKWIDQHWQALGVAETL